MSQEIINKFKLRLEIIITCLGTEAEERYETVFSQGIFLSASQHDADKLLSKTFMIVFLTFESSKQVKGTMQLTCEKQLDFLMLSNPSSTDN